MSRQGRVSRRHFAKGGVAAAVGAIVAPTASVVAGSGTPSASAATVSNVNTQLNSLTGWEVPGDWGVNWRARLNAARTGTSVAVAAIVGDSVGYGYWASNLSATSWVELVRADLTGVGGYGGSGFQSQGRSASVIYNPNSGVPALYRGVTGNVWQESPGWTSQIPPYIYGPGIGAMMATATGAALFNWALGTKIGIWYYDGGAPFTVEIDGVPVATISVGTSYLPAHVVIDVPGGKLVNHSWKITGNYNPVTRLGSTIAGVEGLAASGVRINNFSFPGLYSSFLANQDRPYLTGTYIGGWRNPADLVIYELGANDLAGRDPSYPNGTPPDVWAQNVQTYLNGVMNTTYGGDARGTTDLVLLFPMTNLSGDTHNLYTQYKSRALGLAHTYGAALLDMNAIFRTSWNAWQKAGYAGNQTDPTQSGSDFNHPSDKGHAFMAAQLKPLLTALA